MPVELHSLETRASLLRRIRDFRDDESWELFIRTYGSAIYHFCRRRGVPDSNSADLVQEVLIQVVVSIRSFEYDRGRGRFRDWLGAVVRSRLSRYWRKANHTEATGCEVDQFLSNSSEAEWANELDSHLIHVAMLAIRDSFSPVNWQAFELTWISGYSATEVANKLGIPIAQVYVAKSRISKRLAIEMSHLCDNIPWLAGAS